MAWENSVDRLILAQVHLAEKGELRLPQVRSLLQDLQNLGAERVQTAYHWGYAKTLLGLEGEVPKAGSVAARWYLFGKLRGHDRRGERNWVAELIQDPGQLMDLLSEPEIAASCLPVVMRCLFGSGDLELAVRAIEYLASTMDGDNAELLVDASLSDLLSRIEGTLRQHRCDSCGEVLRRCMALPAFENLPSDVRARYHRALGQYHLQCGEFDSAIKDFDQALPFAAENSRLESSIHALAVLGHLRLHEFEELAVHPERSNRDAGTQALEHGLRDPEHAVPEAWFSKGILSYEVGDYGEACEAFEQAMRSSRRVAGRDNILLQRCRFYLGAGLLTQGDAEESMRAQRLIDDALEEIHPDLETCYAVHEALKKADRRLALKFLDAIEIERGTAPDQLLIIALEYQGLGEADPASTAARRVLEVAVDLDQRVEAMRVLLTCNNMRGDREAARQVFEEIRDLLLQRGAFEDLESLLLNEGFVGQALDHLEIKCELVALYEEMEEREAEKATLQSAIARALRARKDVDSMQEAFAILKEVEIRFPELARDELEALSKLLDLQDAAPVDLEEGAARIQVLSKELGRKPRILVVGGNERQRRHHPRFHELAKSWAFDGEWLMANYTSPQKLVNAIGERLKSGVDLLILLHWNRHETTEPALVLARKHDVAARTVHYAGFTSLQVSLTEMLGRLGHTEAPEAVASGGKGRKK